MVLFPPLVRGRVRVGVKMWHVDEDVTRVGEKVASNVVEFQSAHPHPSLPPVRGKELVVAAMRCNA